MMKLKKHKIQKLAITISCALLFAVFTAQAQDVTLGLKTPRLTTTERDDIQAGSNPYVKGQLIYNTDINCLEYWNGTKWVSLCKLEE